MHRGLLSRRLQSLAAALLAAAAPLATASGSAEGSDPQDPSRPKSGAVRVIIETIVVDGLGTNSVARDEADLFRGQSGVVSKSLTLKGRAGSAFRQEQVELNTRLARGDDDRTSCPLMLAIVATSAPVGAPAATPADAERKALSLALDAGETEMTPAYVSPWTGARITLRITCGEAQPADVPGTWSSMAFDIALERAEDDAPPQLLRSDRLSTTLGREVGSLFSSNRPLPDTAEGERRYRSERLDVQVSPSILSGGRLQVEVRVRGEVATIAASGTHGRHPIDVQETLVLASGESGDIEVIVAASPEEDGWSSVRYLLRVTGRF